MKRDLQTCIWRIATLAYRHGEIGKPWAQWRTNDELATELYEIIAKELQAWDLSLESTSLPHAQWVSNLESRGLAQRSVI